MKICIFTPATAAGRTGNWVTAERWQRLLSAANHQVVVAHQADFNFGNFDLLIGLHAKRSGSVLLQFKKNYPDRPAIVAMTGTDVYRDLAAGRRRKSATAIRTLDVCDRIILLQPLMGKRLRKSWRDKSDVVMKDVQANRVEIQRDRGAQNGSLKICVVGHLRSEKDPFRTALAIRKPVAEFRFQLTQAGAALSDSFRDRADREMQRNPDFRWLGSVAKSRVASLMSESNVLVNSSRMEGAPNVLFESLAIGLPILASKIDGHVGVLGSDYPGYFRVGDTAELRKLLIRYATDSKFQQRLSTRLRQVTQRLAAGNEQHALLRCL